MKLKTKVRGKLATYLPSPGDRDRLRQHCLARARMLDRLADCEMQHGHHAAGERLSQDAAELREVAR